MRSLQRCDFCGDEAVGTFEIVPPALEPTDAEQRRVLLCADCETRLDALLEPLLARLGVDESAGPDGGAATGGADPTAGEREDRDPTDDRRDASDDGTADSGVKTATYVDAETTGPDDEAADPETDGSDRDANAADSAVGGGPDTDDETGGEPEKGGETTGEPESDDETAGEADVEGATDDPRPPSGYSRGMRLLRNREFPMERADAESLVAGAYDLERREVDAIIEYALRAGELDEDGEQLVRP